MSEEKNDEVREEASEEKPRKRGWFGWVRNVVAAVAGAVISCAATIGIIGKSDADIAKERMDQWLGKSDAVYEQVVKTGDILKEVRALIEAKRYAEALDRLNDINDESRKTLDIVQGLKAEIGDAVKAVKEEAARKAASAKAEAERKGQEIKDAVDGVKDAVKDHPELPEKP